MRKLGILIAALATALGAGSASASTHTNPATITIFPAANYDAPKAASPSPSQIVVTGAQSPVTSFTVSLNALNYSRQKDLDVFLVGPSGAAMTLISDVGVQTGGTGPVTLTFSASATASIAGGESLAGGPAFSTGTWLPSDNDFGTDEAGCYLDNSPAGGNTTSFSGFQGTNPNGVWNLYVWHDCPTILDGTIGGWSLNFPDPLGPSVTQPPTQPPADGPRICPKGKKLKKGKCVKKKRKKKRRPKKP